METWCVAGGNAASAAVVVVTCRSSFTLELANSPSHSKSKKVPFYLMFFFLAGRNQPHEGANFREKNSKCKKKCHVQKKNNGAILTTSQRHSQSHFRRIQYPRCLLIANEPPPLLFISSRNENHTLYIHSITFRR